MHAAPNMMYRIGDVTQRHSSHPGSNSVQHLLFALVVPHEGVLPCVQNMPSDSRRLAWWVLYYGCVVQCGRHKGFILSLTQPGCNTRPSIRHRGMLCFEFLCNTSALIDRHIACAQLTYSLSSCLCTSVPAGKNGVMRMALPLVPCACGRSCVCARVCSRCSCLPALARACARASLRNRLASFSRAAPRGVARVVSFAPAICDARSWRPRWSRPKQRAKSSARALAKSQGSGGTSGLCSGFWLLRICWGGIGPSYFCRNDPFSCCFEGYL